MGFLDRILGRAKINLTERAQILIKEIQRQKYEMKIVIEYWYYRIQLKSFWSEQGI